MYVKIFCWTFIIAWCVVLVFHVDGRTRRHILKESRLLAVRGQILTKLGLTNPPTLKANSNTPAREDLEAFKAVNDEVEQMYEQEPESCAGRHDSHGYFAQSVVSLRLVKRTGKTIRYQEPASKRSFTADVNELTFNATQLDGEHHIHRAELRINPKYFPTTSPTGEKIEVCASHPFNSSFLGECSRVLESKIGHSKVNSWLVFDVTAFIKEQVTRPDSKAVVNVVIKSLGPVHHKRQQGKEVSSPPPPYVLVWYYPTDRYEIERRRRNRRALDSKYCKKRPKEKRCCLRRYYIDFHRDLRWTWIHAPTGFYANYCKGKCPFLWSLDNQTHHTSIMALFNSLNPDAPSEPCCVARSYKPLVILHYVDGIPKIEELSNMVVNTCTCL